MSHYTLHTPQSAPEPANAMLHDVRDMLGFVPNIFAVLADTPVALNAFMSANQQFAASSLNAAEREIVQLAVSASNRCGYCVAGHTAFASEIDMPTTIIVALRTGSKIANPKLEALAAFARALAQTGGHDCDAELKAFLAAGYTQHQIPEVVLGVCVKTFSNLISNVLGQPLDDAFWSHAWHPSDR